MPWTLLIMRPSEAMTDQERVAMKQSNDFFNFSSDGKELGGELVEALESGLREEHDVVV